MGGRKGLKVKTIVIPDESACGGFRDDGIGEFHQKGTTMKNRESGATLNEIIISLAVVGVVTAVGLPKLVKLVPNYRLTTTARSLVVHLHRAKLKAIQQGSIYYFDFDLDGDGNLESGGCFLWGDRNGNRRKDLLEKSDMVMDFGTLANVHLQPYSRRLGGPKRGPNNTKIDAGGGDGVSFSQNRIKFNPDGTAVPVPSISTTPMAGPWPFVFVSMA